MRTLRTAKWASSSSPRTFAAEMHLAKIREATQRGRRERVANGKPLAGNRPAYGYRWVDPGKSRLDVEPVNAAVLRSSFDMALKGRSLRSITANQYEPHIPSPTGSPHWRPAVIRDLLHRPVYAGQAVGYAIRSERQPGGRYIRLPSSGAERVPLPGIAPAIMTPQEAATVAQWLATNKAHAIRNNGNPEAALLRRVREMRPLRLDNNRPKRSSKQIEPRCVLPLRGPHAAWPRLPATPDRNEHTG